MEEVTEKFVIDGNQLERVRHVSQTLDLMYLLADGKRDLSLCTPSFTGAMILLSEILQQAHDFAIYVSPH